MVSKLSQFQQRLLLSILFSSFSILVAVLSYSPAFSFLFVIVIAAVASGALWEYGQIARNKGFEPFIALGVMGTFTYLFALYLTSFQGLSAILPEAILWLFFLGLFAYCLFTQRVNPLSNLAVTLFGFAYIAIPLGYMVSINYFHFADVSQDGRWWLLYLIGVTKMSDIGGYFIGKTMGKHRLAPIISPKKTVEGAIGGLLFSILTSFLLWIFTPIALTFWQSIWLACVICAFAQFGDLCESLLKRDGGIKDSNRLPGLGGLLDIIDSMIFVCPVLYLFMKAYQ